MNDSVVEFKSWPENFEKEESGVKANTLRTVDVKDPRFETLRVWERRGNYGIVRIVNTESGRFFERRVTDVTFFGGWVIVSWRGP